MESRVIYLVYNIADEWDDLKLTDVVSFTDKQKAEEYMEGKRVIQYKEIELRG